MLRTWVSTRALPAASMKLAPCEHYRRRRLEDVPKLTAISEPSAWKAAGLVGIGCSLLSLLTETDDGVRL